MMCAGSMSIDMNSSSDKEPKKKRVPRRRQRPSERMFRRSRAAQAKREAQNKADTKLIITLLNLSVLGAMFMALFGFAALRQFSGQEPGELSIWMAQPALFGMSRGVIIGVVIFVLIVGYLIMTVRGRPK